jgi:hypothetical protein
MRWNTIIWLLLVLCAVACSGEDDGAQEPFDFVVPDGGFAEEMTTDMEVVERPEGCRENENLQRLLPVLTGGKNHPTGRGEHASAYDHCNGRIILFGGNDFQPQECADFGPKRFSGETWVYSLEHENWVRLTTDVSPSPRGRHRMVFDSKRNRALMFGGRFRAQEDSFTSPYELYNDLWAFSVNDDRWVELQTTGQGPSPRTNSAMVYDSVNDNLIVFGGSIAPTGTEFRPLDDTYILDLQSRVWRKLDNTGPVERLFHELVHLPDLNAVMLYGGGGVNAFTGPFISDVWFLDLETETWSQVWDRTDSRGPFARINPALVYNAEEGEVLLFAGHDDTAVGHRNDVWTFDVNSYEWTEVIPGDTGAGEGCARFCSCPPDFVSVDTQSPERRQYHSFTLIPDAGDVYLFGGKSDCGYLDDTWRFALDSLSWEEIDPAGQGEACMRTGQDGCTDLCY